MAIKQIGVYNGSGWDLEDIGASASNVTLSNSLVGSNNLQTVLNNILPASRLMSSRWVKADANGRLSSTGDVPVTLPLSGSYKSASIELNESDTTLFKITANKTPNNEALEEVRFNDTSQEISFYKGGQKLCRIGSVDPISDMLGGSESTDVQSSKIYDLRNRPGTNTYSAWLVSITYNSNPNYESYDYIGLVFLGTYNHISDIYKGTNQSTANTVQINSNNCLEIHNLINVYARIGIIRIYNSQS